MATGRALQSISSAEGKPASDVACLVEEEFWKVLLGRV